MRRDGLDAARLRVPARAVPARRAALEDAGDRAQKVIWGDARGFACALPGGPVEGRLYMAAAVHDVFAKGCGVRGERNLTGE